jgi:hypothetical protein
VCQLYSLGVTNQSAQSSSSSSSVRPVALSSGRVLLHTQQIEKEFVIEICLLGLL